MVSLAVVDGRITCSVPYLEPDHKAVIDSEYNQIQKINHIYTHIHVRTPNTSTSEKVKEQIKTDGP